MSYVANQYNYATPLSSALGLFGDSSVVADKKYFSLHDNVLDGSYFPITGDVGLWSTVLSDASGELQTPFVVTIAEPITVNALRIVGSYYNYPVDFTVKLYSGSSLLHTISEVGNTNPDCVIYLPKTYIVTNYEISITRISRANSVAKVYNSYNPGYVKRQDLLTLGAADVGTKFTDDSENPTSEDTVRIKLIEAPSNVSVKMSSYDQLRVTPTEARPSIFVSIETARDDIPLSLIEAKSKLYAYMKATDRALAKIATSTSDLINIHSVMKNPSRRVYGKVYITYTDPMLANETVIQPTSNAYNSRLDQVLDADMFPSEKLFTLYDNSLLGDKVVGDVYSQVGWVSNDLSDANGNFATPQVLRVTFAAPRPVTTIPIFFNTSHGSVVEDFTVEIVSVNGNVVTKTFTGNTEASVTVVDTTLIDVLTIIVSVTKISKPFFPVEITEILVGSTFLYTGYKDRSDLISIDLLEELTYEDDVEALGGISANEVTVMLDNSDKAFYFNNVASPVATQLKRNRKIVPWLGAEIVPGEIEWYQMGVFWSYKWDVPVNGLSATVVGFDTLGLLDTTSFVNHHTQIDKSLAYLIRYILDDAHTVLDFIEYDIDPVLEEIIIPYAWFDRASHTAALRKISQCYPMHIYCDRQGRIVARPQKLKLDFYYDTWADNTNVVDKSYSSLYTTLPNIINVTVVSPFIVDNEQLYLDQLTFDVEQLPSRTFNFSKPYLSNIEVTVECDDSVTYTYEVYSWGIVITFDGAGQVRSIECKGTAVDVSNTSIITQRDDNSVRINGAVTRDIQADFIQRTALARLLIDRLFSLSEHDKYDAQVNYRGDIALTINDPILLQDGIAPDNRYNIKRHELFWNGALSGSADLNT